MSRRAATAHLSVDLTSRRRRGILSRLRDSLSGASRRLSETLPQFIPNDGPADIRLDTRDAAPRGGIIWRNELHEPHAPVGHRGRRSGLLHARDAAQYSRPGAEDSAYKAQTDKIYRERVLSGQLRRLSIFADLSDEQFARVCSQVELITLEPGQVICDEHDASDSFYVIRSGLVKVVKNLHLLLRVEDLPASGWPALLADLAAGRDQSAGALSIISIVWKLLPEPVRNSLAAGTPVQAADPIALSPPAGCCGGRSQCNYQGPGARVGAGQKRNKACWRRSIRQRIRHSSPNFPRRSKIGPKSRCASSIAMRWN